MQSVLGWGVPLLRTGFGSFIPLTFTGNSNLMITCIDISNWFFSEFNKPAMCNNFLMAILLHAVFCIAFMNRAQHIPHFG